MSRARTQQPQYDFIHGGDEHPDDAGPMPFRASIRGGDPRTGTAAAIADSGNEDLRAQVLKLQYELDSFRQERELEAVRHQEEMRAVQAKADDDYKRAQASESSTSAASTRYESLAAHLRTTQDTAVEEKASLERRLKAAQEANSALQEELDEAKAASAEQERQFKRDISDLQARCDALARSDEEARVEHERQSNALELAQQRLAKKEEEVGELENEVMRLKTGTGDADTLAVIKRELSEQVAHIQRLEKENGEQRVELKQFRKTSKGIQVVEEEKKALEAKIARMNDLRKELSETQLQRQILEDERREWAAYLEDNAEGDTQVHFETPQDLAKAFVQERMERASLIDRLGQVTPELHAKDVQIEALEGDKAALASELEKARAGAAPTPNTANGSDTGAVARLERQRALLEKEVSFLRAQLKAFDTEASELQPDTFDASKTERITELESLLEQQRKEAASLHTALSALEANASPQTQQHTPSSPLKRTRDMAGSSAAADGESERLGVLSRKNRSLQDDLSTTVKACKLLQKDLDVARKQLTALKSSSRVRVLELKDNPAAVHTRIQQSVLDALRSENEALLAQQSGMASSGDDDDKWVSRATVTRLRQDLEAKDRELATAAKHDLRLKTIFKGKAMEFNDSVASILGWKLEFMPNGRVKVSSRYYTPPSETGAAAAAAGGKAQTRGAPDADEENYILFDGDEGTMKISGGTRSAFAAEIRGEVEHWVEGMKEIPCFLAALTLKFHERGVGTVML